MFKESLKKKKSEIPLIIFDNCPRDNISEIQYCHSLHILNCTFENIPFDQPKLENLIKVPEEEKDPVLPYPSRGIVNLEDFKGPIIIKNCSFE